MKYTPLFTALIAALCSLSALSMAEPKTSFTKFSEEHARAVLRELQDELYALVAYSDKELGRYKQDYQEFYRARLAGRLKDIGGNIAASALRWIEVDWDDGAELVCWTEGLGVAGYGAKEYVLVIKVTGDDGPKILRATHIDPKPSIDKDGYSYVRFTPCPNKGRGTNGFVRGVLSFIQIGGSACTFYNYTICWNRYERCVDINRFSTPFPIKVEGPD